MARPTWDKRPRTTKKLPDLPPAQAKATVKAAEKSASVKKPASPKPPKAPAAPAFDALAAGFKPSKKKGAK